MFNLSRHEKEGPVARPLPISSSALVVFSQADELVATSPRTWLLLAGGKKHPLILTPRKERKPKAEPDQLFATRVASGALSVL
jgi:hypothetical protein